MLLYLSYAITLWLLVFSIGGIYIIGDYANLIYEVEDNIPLKTELLFASYKFWLVLPTISFLTSVYLKRVDDKKILHQYLVLLILIILFISSIALSFVSLDALYLPIIELGKRSDS